MTSSLVNRSPRKIVVEALLSSRYNAAVRPTSWDDRIPGMDVIRTTSGEILKLQSSGGQSPPQAGYRLILADGEPTDGYRWTLYGITRPEAARC